MEPDGHAASAYAVQGHDQTREAFETTFFAGLLPRLIDEAGGGGAVLDLGCGDGLAARLAGGAIRRWTCVSRLEACPARWSSMICAAGSGRWARSPSTSTWPPFGVASHLAPAELRELLREISRHGRRGSVVALEGLGLHSLESPGIWETEPGPDRALAYRLDSDVSVHPWAPRELAAMYEEAGIRPLRALDRTVQTGPKAGDGRYWPGLPALRRAMNGLLDGKAGEADQSALSRFLPPLPAGMAARVHHDLAARRRRLVYAHADRTAAERSGAAGPGEAAAERGGALARLARAVWALEPRSGGGFGHGLTVLGRVA
jgi:hypothetical protein